MLLRLYVKQPLEYLQQSFFSCAQDIPLLFSVIRYVSRRFVWSGFPRDSTWRTYCGKNLIITRNLKCAIPVTYNYAVGESDKLLKVPPHSRRVANYMSKPSTSPTPRFLSNYMGQASTHRKLCRVSHHWWKLVMFLLLHTRKHNWKTIYKEHPWLEAICGWNKVHQIESWSIDGCGKHWPTIAIVANWLYAQFIASSEHRSSVFAFLMLKKNNHVGEHSK